MRVEKPLLYPHKDIGQELLTMHRNLSPIESSITERRLLAQVLKMRANGRPIPCKGETKSGREELNGFCPLEPTSMLLVRVMVGKVEDGNYLADILHKTTD